MRGTRFLVPVAGLVLIASACGSSSAKADPAADLQVAKGAVLQKSDLPSTFDATPYDSSDDIPESAKLDFANCMNTKLSIFSDTPGEQKANSDTFDDNSSQSETEIQNEVDVYPKKSTVTDDYNLLTKDAAAGCLQKLFTTALQSAATQSTDTTDAGSAPTFGTVTMTKLTVSGVGDHVVGYRATVPITAEGQSVTEYLDLLAATKDRAIVTLTVSNGQTPYDQATELQLLGKSINRIGKQLS
jgi:hypothetical protein